MPDATYSSDDVREGSSRPVVTFLRARTPEHPPDNNLPLELSSFVGREQEIAEVKRLLAEHRLLTLTGPGGCGKTRLALEVAAELVEGFKDGAWLVELASLSYPALVPQAVASVLGVREQPGRSLTETLSNHLKLKELLLVLDNCEHLVEACAELAEALLRTCPSLRILATSREALGTAGETRWLVPSLSLPDPHYLPPVEELPQYEATRLFIERAAVLPTFKLTDRNAAVVAKVCQRLEGIPLAIELAAARVRVLTVEQIAERLDDRFRLLRTSSRTALPQHRTLRAAMDWSHELLSDKEQILFRRLSVFAGGFTLEATEAACVSEGIEKNEVLDLLSHLVDKSLVLVVEGNDEEAHYRLLETVRQYGQEKLNESGEVEAIRDHHAGFFLKLAEEAEQAMLGPEQEASVGRLEREHDNLRAALGWLKECGEAERGLRLGGALVRFWWFRGYFTEGRAWLEKFLELAEAASVGAAARAKALHALGALIYRNADWAAGDQEVARSRLEESLKIYRGLGDGPHAAAVLSDLGLLSSGAGHWERAFSSLAESLELERRSGNERGIALTRTYLGFLALLQGDHGPTHARLQESLGILRELGGTDDINACLLLLGHLACEQGDYTTARARFTEMMKDAPNLQLYRYAAPSVLQAYARLAAGEGQAARALRLAGAADVLRQTVGPSAGPAYQAYFRRGLEPAWRELSEEEGAAAWEEGWAMTLEEAIACALAKPATPYQERAHPPPSAGMASTETEISIEEPHPEGLTTREAEVLRLLAGGKTNKEIAEELVLSVSTVERHVANIYAKIGARGRVEATVYALRRGISEP